MAHFPRIWKLLAPRYSLRTLMLVVTLVGIGLWWGQRAVFFRQMAERHRGEANIYRALQEAHPSMADKCTAIVKYHTGLEAIYRNAVYTPWMIIYEHPYETSVVREVKLTLEPPVESQPSPGNTLQAELGMEGYCPVTLAQNEQWIQGDRKFSASFDGRTYRFAGPDELQAFLENPQKFAPAYRGNDIVRLVDEQWESPGQRRHGIRHSDKTYLFDSEKTLAAFQASPAKYIAQAELGPITR